MDPFEDLRQEVHHPPAAPDEFPSFNTQWLPQFDEGIETKAGKSLEKGSDILKKASSFYMFALALAVLIIFLPPIIRFLYGLSRFAYDKAGSIFP